MRRIQILREFRIAGLTYRVESSERVKEELDRRNSWGYADYVRKKILLDNTMDEEDVGLTFLHELLHHASAVHDCSLTEQQTRALSLSLADVLGQHGIGFKL